MRNHLPQLIFHAEAEFFAKHLVTTTFLLHFLVAFIAQMDVIVVLLLWFSLNILFLSPSFPIERES